MCDFGKKLKQKRETRPVLKEIRGVPGEKVVAELKELGLELMLKAKFQQDRYIYHVGLAGWEKLVPYLVISGKSYLFPPESPIQRILTPEAPDCDDYSKRASATAAFEFGVSCLGCQGATPYKSEKNPTGRHAFNLVRVGDGDYRIFEPNAAFEEAGELFRFGEHGYIPDAWRL